MADDAPFLRIVRGDATPEEVAAIVATLTAIAAARTPVSEHESVRTNWNDRARLLRAPLHPAPGAWRRSVLP
ncbi:MAG TPA: acyl-CoA carboxylase subunit epsilon [Trebonia sp.]|nr:acyl-CoA carboxylase subunit epsilon [Trebonia sp.]